MDYHHYDLVLVALFLIRLVSTSLGWSRILPPTAVDALSHAASQRLSRVFKTVQIRLQPASKSSSFEYAQAKIEDNFNPAGNVTC